jgi:hypothetical protein
MQHCVHQLLVAAEKHGPNPKFESQFEPNSQQKDENRVALVDKIPYKMLGDAHQVLSNTCRSSSMQHYMHQHLLAAEIISSSPKFRYVNLEPTNKQQTGDEKWVGPVDKTPCKMLAETQPSSLEHLERQPHATLYAPTPSCSRDSNQLKPQV